MKTKMKALTALLLAAMTALVLPMSALATVYSGTYNNIYYTCTTGGNSQLLYGKLETGTATKLTIIEDPVVFYFNGNTFVRWENAVPVMETLNNSTSNTVTKTYYEYYLAHSLHLNSSGYFKSSSYTFKIANHVVESFSEYYM